MRAWLIVLGAATGAVVYYLFICFVLWGIPAPLGSIEPYERFFIALFWFFSIALGTGVVIRIQECEKRLKQSHQTSLAEVRASAIESFAESTGFLDESDAKLRRFAREYANKIRNGGGGD